MQEVFKRKGVRQRCIEGKESLGWSRNSTRTSSSWSEIGPLTQPLFSLGPTTDLAIAWHTLPAEPWEGLRTQPAWCLGNHYQRDLSAPTKWPLLHECCPPQPRGGLAASGKNLEADPRSLVIIFKMSRGRRSPRFQKENRRIVISWQNSRIEY